MTLFDEHPAGPPAGVVPDTVRLRLVVAYDGSGFRGFASQPGQLTVAGEMASAIARVVGHPVELTCAGRTDAGVHASGQVVHVDVRSGADPDALARSVNAMLAPAVVVRRADIAEAGFDARRSALARHYRYLVLQSEVPDPSWAPVAWQVAEPLDLRSMAAGADALLGEHDFRAFCRRPPGSPPEEPLRRRVMHAAWRCLPDPFDPDGTEGRRVLGFDIVARSFCHQMVRSVVGTLVDVGRGKRRAADIPWLLASTNRPPGATIAPPHGLCLVRVDY